MGYLLSLFALFVYVTEGSLLPAHKVLTIADAEKILGTPVRLTDSSNADTKWRKCTYTTISKNRQTGTESNFYFAIEEASAAAAAHETMISIKTSNAHDSKIEELPGIADEAFAINNLPGGYLILVRKGNIVFRYKLPKPPPTFSTQKLQVFAKRTAAAITFEKVVQN